MTRGKSWIEVSEQHLKANFEELKRAAGNGVSVLAVIKADAYGHGAALCSQVLAQAGSHWLGVTDVAEAMLVQDALRTSNRKSHTEPEILILSGFLPEDADAIVTRELTPTVWTMAQIEVLAAAVRRRGRASQVPIHLEIDTGMSRQGVQPGEALGDALRSIRRSEWLRLDGVLTHFASAEVMQSQQTARQRKRFEEALDQVDAAGLRPAWIHAGNTSSVDNWHLLGAVSNGDWLQHLAGRFGSKPMVRSGLALYGYSLPLERVEGSERRPGTIQLVASSGAGGSWRAEDHALGGLSPVMTWKTRVIGISEVVPGSCVGYNATFTARQPMRLALLPVGYADGLRRELSGGEDKDGGWVSLRGRRAPIVGRISMNLTTVDVTGIDDISEGDEVVLLGEGFTAEDHARLAGTISYEILCGVRPTSRFLV